MRKIIFVPLMLLFLISLAYAQDLSTTDLKVIVDETGLVHIEQEVIVRQAGAHYISIPKTAYLDVYDTLNPATKVSYEITETNGVQNLTLDIDEDLIFNDLAIITLEYSTNVLTSKQGDVWTLSLNYKTTPGSSDIKILFPLGIKIINTQSKDDVYSLVEGRNFVMEIEPSDIVFDLKTKYELGETIEEPDYTWLFVGLILIGAVALTITFWFKSSKDMRLIEHKMKKFSKPKKVKGKRRVKSSISKVLDEKELKVVRFLESRIDASHAQISRGTSIVKTTLSKVLKRLENRNIIEKSPFGKRHRIALQKWVFTEGYK